MENEEFITWLEKSIRDTPNPRDKLTLKWMAFLIMFFKSDWNTKIAFLRDKKEVRLTIETLRKDIYDLKRSIRVADNRGRAQANQSSIGGILPSGTKEGREGRREGRRRDR